MNNTTLNTLQTLSFKQGHSINDFITWFDESEQCLSAANTTRIWTPKQHEHKTLCWFVHVCWCSAQPDRQMIHWFSSSEGHWGLMNIAPHEHDNGQTDTFVNHSTSLIQIKRLQTLSEEQQNPIIWWITSSNDSFQSESESDTCGAVQRHHDETTSVKEHLLVKEILQLRCEFSSFDSFCFVMFKWFSTLRCYSESLYSQSTEAHCFNSSDTSSKQ